MRFSQLDIYFLVLVPGINLADHVPYVAYTLICEMLSHVYFLLKVVYFET